MLPLSPHAQSAAAAASAHSFKLRFMRILRSPITAYQQQRSKRNPSSNSILPMFSTSSYDSQEKYKSKTLGADLFTCVLFTLLVLGGIFFLSSPSSPSLSVPSPSSPEISSLELSENKVVSADATSVEVEVTDDATKTTTPPDNESPTPEVPSVLRTMNPDLHAALEQMRKDMSGGKVGLEQILKNGLKLPAQQLGGAAAAGGEASPPVVPPQQQVSTDDTNPAPGVKVPKKFRTGSDRLPPGPHDPVNDHRRKEVVEAFRHAWGGYEQFAWGKDEVRPVSNEPHNSWGGWGASMIDGLDTLMIMAAYDKSLEPEVGRARAFIAGLNFDRDFVASFFETTIRFLGGLLGAYEISRDKLYLEKGQQLADLLIHGFDASPTGIPKSKINLGKHTSENQRWAGGQSILAEIGSIQLEFEYLSFHTGDKKYAEKARKVFEILDKAPKSIKGLYPTYIDPESASFANQHISFGSFGDSFYEYLFKLYLLTDRRDQESLRMFNEAMESMENHMIKTRKVAYFDTNTNQEVTNEFAFLGELNGGSYLWKMEHLTCFVPGLLALATSMVVDEADAPALGIRILPRSAAVMQHHHEHSDAPGVSHTHSETSGDAVPQVTLTPQEQVLKSNAAKHTRTSTNLLRTCTESYMQTATGLAAETIEFHFPAGMSADEVEHLEKKPLLGPLFRIGEPKYILRPETIESIFIHYRLTGDEIYREIGWRIFKNLLRSCKTHTAFSAIADVNYPNHGRLNPGFDARETQNARHEYEQPGNWMNSQESFFFAETLKYFYLLFSPVDVIPLDEYVFNTEAHPLGVLVSHADN